MIPFPLGLKPAVAREPVAAWYMPGGGPDQWIAELAAWGLPMGGHRLYLVPSAPGERTLGGLLVIPGEARKPQATARAQGYALIGGKLLMPVESRLDPPVAPAELERRLPGPLYWLHPAVGLVMFKDEEALRVRDLIELPESTPRQWNRAQSGISRPSRLLSVEPDHEPSVEQVLDDAREDIGSESADTMPPSELEPGAQDGADGGVGGSARKKALQAIEWLTGKAPEKSNEPTWVDRVQDWARKKLKALDPNLRAERHKELSRLLRMLREDPDKGLKYAIPLRGGANRGMAEPGARLGQHGTDFDLNRLGGGRPGDSWDTPWEFQQRLLAEYRNAAQRAHQLGRHRRAAYIYAELLGDFDAAANVLRQGRHFREAAVLYRDKLKKPLEAAKCLEEGGLLVEAIAVYETLGSHMKVGELYERLERPEEAMIAYRRAVEEYAITGDLVRAAQVLEERVKAPEEALTLLESGWPGASQAALCLRESYALLARLGRHERALKRTELLAREPVPAGKLVVLVQTLVQVARTYPDLKVRDTSSDLTRVLAGNGLEGGPEADASALVHAVAELVPADHLLERDVHRYLDRRRKRVAPPAPVKGGSRVPVEVRRLQLLYPREYTWKTAVACGEHFYALGLHMTNKPTLVRSTFDGRLQQVQWSEGLAGLPKALVEPPQSDATSALVWLPGGPALGPRLLAANDRLPRAIEAGTPSWLPDQAIGLTRDERDVAWVLRREGQTELLLASYSPKGALLGTVALESGPQTARVNLLGKQQGNKPPPAAPVPMAARSGHVFVVLGSRMLHLFNQARSRPTELQNDARTIEIAPPHAHDSAAVVVTYSAGVSVLWPSTTGDKAAPQNLAMEKSNLLACFTRGGQLVLMNRDEGQVWEGPPGRMVQVASFPGPGSPPIALMPGDRRDEFAVIVAAGSVGVFRIPAASQT